MPEIISGSSLCGDSNIMSLLQRYKHSEVLGEIGVEYGKGGSQSSYRDSSFYRAMHQCIARY